MSSSTADVDVFFALFTWDVEQGMFVPRTSVLEPNTNDTVCQCRCEQGKPSTWVPANSLMECQAQTVTMRNCVPDARMYISPRPPISTARKAEEEKPAKKKERGKKQVISCVKVSTPQPTAAKR